MTEKLTGVGDWLKQRTLFRLGQIMNRLRLAGATVPDSPEKLPHDPVGVMLREIAAAHARCDLLEQAINGLAKQRHPRPETLEPAVLN